MARRKRKKADNGGGGGGWITTFADLMSLLLTFFILLFSMSSVSDEKFSAASQSLQGALIGELSGGSILDDNGVSPKNTGSGNGDDHNTSASANENSIPAEVTKMYEEALKVIEEELSKLYPDYKIQIVPDIDL